MTSDSPDLATLLERHYGELRSYLLRHASGLLHYESVSDLAQGVCAAALSGREQFEYRGEAAFRGWIERIAIGHVSHRHEYWKAERRDAGRLLRLSANDASVGEEFGGAVRALAASITSPSSFAARRERLAVAARALALLPDRDRAIARAMIEGRSVDELAAELGISRDAAERARLRTLARFEKTLRVLLGPGA